MNLIADFFTAVLTAIVLQNVFFTRGLGTSRTLFGRRSRTTLFLGLSVTFIVAVSAMIVWPLNHLMYQRELSASLGVPILYLSALSSLLCVCLMFLFVYYFSRRYLPGIFYMFQPAASRALFNCAVIGPILLTYRSGFGFFQTAGYALGSGLGYTLALLLLAESHKRLMLSDVPRAFRGFPILLLYAGIFSLAIYGLIGHQLPT